MIVHAPAHLAPARIDTMASQIDVAPTVLGLLRAGALPSAQAASRWTYR
jgi:arylsulfatase A-like enzyme